MGKADWLYLAWLEKVTICIELLNLDKSLPVLPENIANGCMELVVKEQKRARNVLLLVIRMTSW